MTDAPGLSDIERARSRLAARIRRTPLVPSRALSRFAGVPVALKLEHHQVTGSFKLRGAMNAVARLTDTQKSNGVVKLTILD